MGHELTKNGNGVVLQVWGNSLETLFTDGMTGLMHVLGPNVSLAPSQKKSTHVIKLESPNLKTLLLSFLSKVLVLSLANKEIYSNINFRELSDTKLTAQIEGVRIHALVTSTKQIGYQNVKLTKSSSGEYRFSCNLRSSRKD